MKEKKKSLTKRMSAVLLIMASLLSLAIGGLIGAFAASMQSVGAGFEIEYSVGNNISAKVSAKYQVVGDDEVDIGNITFSATDAEGSVYSTLKAPGQIILTGQKQSVVFTYTFQNTGMKDFAVTQEDNSLLKNVNVHYTPASIIVKKDETCEVTVLVEISNVNISAQYLSTIEHGLVWTLSTI